MTTGTVKWFNETKGFGLIAQEDEGPDLFVHHSEIKTSEPNSLKEGEKVMFKIGLGPKGLAALNVTVL